MNMVIKTIKRHVEINADYVKLFFRNFRSLSCPVCDIKVSKMKSFTICKKCDDKISNSNKNIRKKIIERIRNYTNHSECSICSKNNLEGENKLFYCISCDTSFHA